MKYNGFWKFLGDFWSNEYIDKEHIEYLWGSWINLITDYNLYLQQVNLCKSLKDIPTYWKRLWVPIFTNDSLVEHVIVNSYKEYSTTVIIQNEFSYLPDGAKFLIPGTIKIYDEFDHEIALENVEIDYWNGKIKINPSLSFLTPGYQIKLKCNIGINIKNNNFKNLTYNSEGLYDFENKRWLQRNKDYKINYSDGTVDLKVFSNKVIFFCKYNNLNIDYPYIYPLLPGFYNVEKLYCNTNKKGKVLLKDQDFKLIIAKDPATEISKIAFKYPTQFNLYWAEEAWFSFDNIYRMFGNLVGFRDVNSEKYKEDVTALTYFFQNAPTLKNIEGACHKLLGYPVCLYEGEVVKEIYINDSGEYLVETDKNVYNTFNHYPVVREGQKLKYYEPLTDVLEVLDNVKDPALLDTLLVKKIVYSDDGFEADDGYFSDSMWDDNSIRRLLLPWHTFVINIKDFNIIKDKTSLKKIKYLLTNKPSWTTYIIYFTMSLIDNWSINSENLKLDIEKYIFEDFWGASFNEDLCDPLDEEIQSVEKHSDCLSYSNHELLRSYYIDSFGPNGTYYSINITNVRDLNGNNKSFSYNPVTLEVYCPDLASQRAVISSVLIHTLPNPIPFPDGTERSSISKNGEIIIEMDSEGIGYPFNPQAVDTGERLKRYTDVFKDGMTISPYFYTINEVKGLDNTIYNFVFDNTTFKMKVEDAPNKTIIIKATQKNREDNVVIKDLIEEITLDENGEGFAFKEFILPETLKIYGSNTENGVVQWSVKEYSSFGEGEYSVPFEYNSVLMNSFNVGKDYIYNIEENTLNLTESSLILDGEYVIFEYTLLEKGNFDFETIPLITTNPIPKSREQISYSKKQTSFTILESIYSNSIEECDATLNEIALLDKYNDSKSVVLNGDDFVDTTDYIAPICTKVVPKKSTQVLGEYSYPEYPVEDDFDIDYHRSIQLLDTNDLELIPSGGTTEYPYEYILPWGYLYITRLTLKSDTYKYREIEYIVEEDFIIPTTAFNKDKWHLFSKTPLIDGIYEVWRTGSIDLARKNKIILNLNSANFLGDVGGEFPYKYLMPIDYNLIEKISNVPDSNYEFGDIVLKNGEDFVVNYNKIYLKEQPIIEDFFVWDYRYSYWDRKYNSEILEILDSNKIDGFGREGYNFTYKINISLMEAKTLIKLADSNYNYGDYIYFNTMLNSFNNGLRGPRVLKKDYIITSFENEDFSYISFREEPCFGEYEVWGGLLKENLNKDNLNYYETLRIYDTLDKVVMIMDLHHTDPNFNMNDKKAFLGYVTERYGFEDTEIRVSKSYDPNRLIGPSVPMEVICTTY